jgi:hypothetical protein
MGGTATAAAPLSICALLLLSDPGTGSDPFLLLSGATDYFLLLSC